MDDPFAAVRLFPEIGQPTWVELIIATYVAPHTHLHRELADPNVFANVRSMALAHGVRPLEGFKVYLRKASGSVLELIDWSYPVETGLSVVVVPSSMPLDGLTRVISELTSRPGILPTRMIWPI